jgi:hypothetical protein
MKMPAPCFVTFGLKGTDAKHQHFLHTEGSGRKNWKSKEHSSIEEWNAVSSSI